MRAQGWLSAATRFVGGLRPGTLEMVFALLLMIPFILVPPRYASTAPWALVLELLICLAAGFFGRWPVTSGCLVGLGLTAMAVLVTFVFDPSNDLRWSSFAVAIPLISAGTHGRRTLQGLLAVWYWLVLTVIEMAGHFTANDFIAAATIWGVWVGLFILVSVLIRRIADERRALQAARLAAVQSQRRTIARDLHDTTAYATTSIILRAEQAKLRGVTDPDMLADLDYIIAAGRRSMRDLRGMMETLRRNEPDGGADVPPSPWQIAPLDEIVDRRLAELTDNGFRASAHVEADLDSLPESVSETLAKVVVEATANMVKHGDRSAPCSIMIESDGDEVEAVFINTPATTSRLGRQQSTPLGLVGARERVEALGGECSVTSTSPTWVLRARIPIGV